MRFNTKSDRKSKKDYNYQDDEGFVNTGYCTNGIPNLNYVVQTPSAEHMIKNRKVNYKKKDVGTASTNKAEEFLFALKSSKIMKKSTNLIANVEKKKISFKTIGLSFTGLFKPSKRIGRNANNFLIDDNGQVIYTEQEQMIESPQQKLFQQLLPNQYNYLLQQQQQPQLPANLVSMVNMMQNDASKPSVRKNQPQMGVRALYTKRNLSNQDETDNQSSNPKKRERSSSNSFRKNSISCVDCKNLSCSCNNKSSDIFVRPEPVKAAPFLDSIENARKFARSSSYTNMSAINITVSNPQVELNITPIKPVFRKNCKTVKKLSCISLNPQNQPFTITQTNKTNNIGFNYVQTYSTYV